VRSPSAHGGMAARTAAPRISTPDPGVLSHGRDPGPGNHCNSCQCSCFIRFGNIKIQEKTMRIAAESVHYDSNKRLEQLPAKGYILIPTHRSYQFYKLSS
jgi:hypothetical protein